MEAIGNDRANSVYMGKAGGGRLKPQEDAPQCVPATIRVKDKLYTSYMYAFAYAFAHIYTKFTSNNIS